MAKNAVIPRNYESPSLRFEDDVIEKNEKPDSELPGFSVRMKGLEPSCPREH